MSNAIYGYCRISRKTQNIERQERNILGLYPNALILSEAYTGTKQDRPQWQKLLKVVKPGDTIIFDSVSRMSRNAEDGIKIYFDLFNKGINLIFLNEPYINTDTYRTATDNSIEATGNDIADIYIEATNKVIRLLAEKQIIQAFEQAQKEVDDLHKRTQQGLLTARLNGKRIGLPKGSKIETKKAKESKELIIKLSKDFNGTNTDKEVMAITKLARNTYYKYKNELKNA